MNQFLQALFEKLIADVEVPLQLQVFDHQPKTGVSGVGEKVEERRPLFTVELILAFHELLVEYAKEFGEAMGQCGLAAVEEDFKLVDDF